MIGVWFMLLTRGDGTVTSPDVPVEIIGPYPTAVAMACVMAVFVLGAVRNIYKAGPA